MGFVFAKFGSGKRNELEILPFRLEKGGWKSAGDSGSLTSYSTNFYTVKSQSGKGEYAIYQVDGELHCECPDHIYRYAKCKHLFAVKKEFWTLKKETRTEHIRHIKLRDDIHNNKMECMNGSSRPRKNHERAKN
jgi:hypothetical protein